MITALVRVKHGPEALAVTLSALVPAVAAGLVGDAVVVAETRNEVIESVADAAGATLVVTAGDPWKEGARAARRDWLLCLDDGDIPQEGWIRVLDRFVALGASASGLARLRRQHEGAFGAWGNRLAAVLRGRRVRAGDLVHRRVLLGDGRVRAPVRLAASIGRDPVISG